MVSHHALAVVTLVMCVMPDAAAATAAAAADAAVVALVMVLLMSVLMLLGRAARRQGGWPHPVTVAVHARARPVGCGRWQEGLVGSDGWAAQWGVNWPGVECLLLSFEPCWLVSFCLYCSQVLKAAYSAAASPAAACTAAAAASLAAAPAAVVLVLVSLHGAAGAAVGASVGGCFLDDECGGGVGWSTRCCL